MRPARKAAQQTAAVGSTYSPERASAACAARIWSSLTVTTVPPVSRTAARICSPRAGRAMAMPSAIVSLATTVSGVASPRRKALASGAHPPACTAAIEGSRLISPWASSSRQAR